MSQPLIRAEIDLGAIAHNVRELRRITNPKAKLLIAVKADGYGHGAVRVARTALENGADQLGVARLEEGVALRDSGIGAPVLVLGYAPPEQASMLLDYQLTPTLYNLEHARKISAAVAKHRRRLKFHIKVDSGMGRLGVPCRALRLETDAQEQVVEEIRAMANLAALDLSGLFTHFATADHADKAFAQLQFSRFQELLSELETKGLTVPVRHAANSGAIIEMPETHLDLVRAGISVYGLYPSPEVDQHRIDLHPALQLKTRIIHLKRVPAGTLISYGGTYETPGPTKIATLPVGYGDGFNRRLSNRGRALVRGIRAPIVGRVCMDLTMLDVGHIQGVAVDDEVVLIGRQGDAFIPADEIADLLDTINYEVVTTLMARVPRVYIEKPES